MPNKLQELTDRLYNEGLSKGKEEGELLLANARKEAEETIAKAKLEAESIVAAAEKKAAELASKAESDVKTASEQCLQATKKDIENLLTNALCSEKVSDALADPDYIKKIISTVAEKFSTTESADLSLILPASLQDTLEGWVKTELGKTLGKTVKAEFSKKVSGGFSIGPADGSWYVSLTDETFKELIAEFLRPATRKLLFG